MKLTKILLSALCCISLLSCKNDYSTQLNDIDELSINYIALEKKVLNIDLKESKKHLKKYEDTIEEFKLLLNKDKKPSKEVTSFINQFRSVKKTFKKVPKKVSFLKSNIKKNITQLENLENDVNKNVFNQEELGKIINDELEVFQALDKEYINLTLEIKNQIEKFDSLLILSNNINF